MSQPIRERLGLPTLEERLERAAAEQQFQETLSAELEYLERKSEEREGPRHDRDGRYRNSDTVQREAIRNIDKALSKALAKVDDKRLHAELPKWYEDDCVDPKQDERYSRYVEEMQADVRNNFMYDLYIEQLFDESIEAISPSYATFSLVVALKAALTLVATRPALCRELGIEDSVLRERSVIYKDQLERGLHPYDSAQGFVSSIMYEVPGLYDIANHILAAYETAMNVESAVAERDGKPLPNDADAAVDRRIDRQDALDRAVVMLASTNDSLLTIAKRYGISNRVLSEEAKRRGVARPRGRPKGGRL